MGLVVMTTYIARWLDHATRDCLCEDGIRDFSTSDLAQLGGVTLVRNDDELKAFQREIESELDAMTNHDENEKRVYQWERQKDGDFTVSAGDEELAVLTLTEIKT